MGFIKTSVKRPLTIIMIFCVIVVFGIMGYTKMPMDLMPEVEVPVLAVITTWPGAGPEDVEEQVTEVIEKKVAAVAGVDELMSISKESASAVIMLFDYDVDISEATNTVRSKLETAQMELPDDVQKPMVSEMDINAMPIGRIAVTSKKTGDIAMMRYAEDTIKQCLEQTKGVVSVDITGGKTEEVTIEADPAALSHYGVTLSSISNTLKSANKTFPYGKITEGKQDITIRGVNKLETLEDISSLQIPTNTGLTVRLDTVATIKKDFKEKESIYRYNGENALILDISKQQSANTVSTMREVRKAINKLNKENPQFEIIFIEDQSEFIEQSIGSVWSTLIMSAIIAFVIILLFLKNTKASFIVSTAIPLSILGAVAGMYFTGGTLNMISIGGLSLGVGMVVDNSIVVIENIYKRKHDGETNLQECAIWGTSTIANAVIASTLTTVAVFLPIMFTEGLTKIMFGSLSAAVILSLVFSLIVSLTLIPSLYAKFAYSRKGKLMEEKPDKIFSKLKDKYAQVLKHALKHKKLTVLVGFVLLVVSFGLAGQVGFNFMPEVDQSAISITAKLPKNLDLESSDYYATMIEGKLKDIPEIKKLITSIDNTDITSSGNSAYFNCELADKNERNRSDKDIAEEMRNKLATIPDCEITVSTSQSAMPVSSGVELEITGKDIKVLEVLANQMAQKMKEIEGLRNVETSIADKLVEAQLEIDTKKAAEWGVNPQEVTSLLRTSITGDIATTIDIENYKVDVNLKLEDNSITSVDNLNQLLVQSRSGADIPIGAFTDITMEESSPTIRKNNRKQVITVSASLYGIDSGTAMKQINAITSEMVFPIGYEIAQGGSIEMMMDAFKNLAMALTISILLVYIVMVAQFESFKKPFIIMFSVPFAFVGVILGLLLAGSSFSVPAFIGVIMLCGIVVNNGIVLIDHIDQLRVQGDYTLEEAISQGGADRLRPVLMTTLTTVVAMIPLALGIGEGSETMAPMAIVVIGGLTISTLVTLIFIPTVYGIFEKMTEKRKQKREAKWAKRKEKMHEKMDKASKDIPSN